MSRPLALAVLALSACLSLDASADAPAVRVGEVTARAPADTQLVRASLESALRARSFRAPRRRAIVSASLLTCDERRCVISAALRDATRGTVFAIVEGSARSEAPAPRGAMVQAAAESAARKVQQALE